MKFRLKIAPSILAMGILGIIPCYCLLRQRNVILNISFGVIYSYDLKTYASQVFKYFI